MVIQVEQRQKGGSQGKKPFMNDGRGGKDETANERTEASGQSRMGEKNTSTGTEGGAGGRRVLQGMRANAARTMKKSHSTGR